MQEHEWNGRGQTKESWKLSEREREEKNDAGMRKGKGFMRELLFTEAEHRQKGRDKNLSATLRTTPVNMFHTKICCFLCYKTAKVTSFYDLKKNCHVFSLSLSLSNLST